MKRILPQYLARQELSAAPIDFAWKGLNAHIGPIEGTAMHDAFNSVTFLTGQAIAASICEWGLARLSSHAELGLDIELIEAIRAWQVDALYFKVNPLSLTSMVVREGDPTLEAASNLSNLIGRTLKGTWIDTPSPAPGGFAHVAFLVKHVIPKKQRKAYEEWLGIAFDRARTFAARPKEPMPGYKDCNEDDAVYFAAGRPYFGLPIPPQAFDPAFPYDNSERVALVDEFLQNVDWAHNRFLRSPEELKAAGFVGTPYRYGE